MPVTVLYPISVGYTLPMRHDAILEACSDELDKIAKAWGESLTSTWGAGKSSGGFVTQYRSAGMPAQAGSSSINTRGLLKGLSNVESAGLKSPAKLTGAGSIARPKLGKSLSKPTSMKSTSSSSTSGSKLS